MEAQSGRQVGVASNSDETDKTHVLVEEARQEGRRHMESEKSDPRRGGQPEPARHAGGTGRPRPSADRPTPRFPPSRVPWVTDRVRETFDNWRVGPGTTVISGGARGADIIGAEEGYSRGAHVMLCLALPADEFRRRSVDLPGTDWGSRFRRLLSVAEVRELTAVATVADG